MPGKTIFGAQEDDDDDGQIDIEDAANDDGAASDEAA
jgi:hypothetical protein